MAPLTAGRCPARGSLWFVLAVDVIGVSLFLVHVIPQASKLDWRKEPSSEAQSRLASDVDTVVFMYGASYLWEYSDDAKWELYPSPTEIPWAEVRDELGDYFNRPVPPFSARLLSGDERTGLWLMRSADGKRKYLYSNEYVFPLRRTKLAPDADGIVIFCPYRSAEWWQREAAKQDMYGDGTTVVTNLKSEKVRSSMPVVPGCVVRQGEVLFPRGTQPTFRRCFPDVRPSPDLWDSSVDELLTKYQVPPK